MGTLSFSIANPYSTRPIQLKDITALKGAYGLNLPNLWPNLTMRNRTKILKNALMRDSQRRTLAISELEVKPEQLLATMAFKNVIDYDLVRRNMMVPQ
mmetsp:Transcript_14537/g.22012  ORF Transcript_14537/g.22012 Transcript_14537/m.22012 type:complete len:98 (-) Transcript_14537:1088-1381(-)